MPQEYREMGVVPGSPLAQLLTKLGRRDRRDLLIVLQSPPGPRRARRERSIHKRLRALGLE